MRKYLYDGIQSTLCHYYNHNDDGGILRGMYYENIKQEKQVLGKN